LHAVSIAGLEIRRRERIVSWAEVVPSLRGRTACNNIFNVFREDDSKTKLKVPIDMAEKKSTNNLNHVEEASLTSEETMDQSYPYGNES
jgi:hypothetical protein